MFDFIKNLLGGSNEKEIRRLMKTVEKILARLSLWQRLVSLQKKSRQERLSEASLIIKCLH